MMRRALVSHRCAPVPKSVVVVFICLFGRSFVYLFIYLLTYLFFGPGGGGGGYICIRSFPCSKCFFLYKKTASK